MSKATPADLEALGFHTSQFGTPTDFTAYLQAVLDDEAMVVAALVGATNYAAAGDLTAVRVKRAEIYYAAGELWRRIENFERRNAHKGREGGGTETIGSRANANAAEWDQRANAEIAQVTGSSPYGGVAASVVETGHFDSTQ